MRLEQLLTNAMRYLVCAIFTLLFNQYASAQSLPSLIPYRDGNKWGYSDTNGNIIIAPQWDRAELFTTAGKAKVHLDQKNLANEMYRVVCLIDTNGAYIIPPERNWTGYFYNPRYARINAYNGKGYGMIDSNNHEIIPLEYDLTHYDMHGYYAKWNKHYSHIRKNGRWGLLDTAGMELISFEYDRIDTLAYSDHIYFVTGKNESNGHHTLLGLTDTLNNTLIPHQYLSVQYHNSAGGGFTVLDTAGKAGWIEDRTFKLWLQPGKYDDVMFVDKETMIASMDRKYGVVTLKGKTLLPFTYHGIYRSHDSLFAYQHAEGFMDIVYIFRLKDYKLIGQTTSPYPVVEAMDISGDRDHPYTQPAPCIQKTKECVQTFNKSSINWEVLQVANRSKGYYSVTGMHNEKKTPFTAVVDTSFNYVVSPRPGYTILTYHPETGIMLVKDRKLYKVMDEEGNILSSTDAANKVLDVLKWKENIYYLTDGGRYDSTFLVGINGKTPKQLKPYRVVGIADSAGVFLRGFRYAGGGSVLDGFTGYFLATTGKQSGIITPDGDILYPAISFRSCSVDGLGYGYFNVSDPDANSYLFVNSQNQPVLPTRYSKAVHSTTQNGYSEAARGIPLPGLFKVEYKDADYREQHVYMDKTGRIYGVNMSFLK